MAKNILTVGAVNDVSSYTGPSSVVMSDFSGWGPTDDGRIKPDIVANGVSLYSTHDNSNSSYATASGTSMSAPNATGTLVLLQQHYQNTHNRDPMHSATLKALVIHTADECGDYTGPDYKFGWGLLNADEAAGVISDDATEDGIIERYLSNGGSYSRTVTATGTEALRVTMVWTDPHGTPVQAQLDPTDVMLVNDLDLRVTKDGTTYYPWKLDRANPSAAATNSTENNVDNVEQVYIGSPVAGAYTIEVDHDGSLTNDSQWLSLIITGIQASSNPPSCSADLISPGDEATDVPLSATIEWQSADHATSYDLYFGTDNPPTNIVNGSNQSSTTYDPDPLFNTTYYVKVIPRNSYGAATGCSIWSFTTGTELWSDDFDEFSWSSDTGNDWENISTGDDFDWTVRSGSTPSSGTGPDSDHTSGLGQYLYTEASSPNYPNKAAYLLSPTFDLSSYLPHPSVVNLG